MKTEFDGLFESIMRGNEIPDEKMAMILEMADREADRLIAEGAMTNLLKQIMAAIKAVYHKLAGSDRRNADRALACLDKAERLSMMNKQEEAKAEFKKAVERALLIHDENLRKKIGVSPGLTSIDPDRSKRRAAAEVEVKGEAPSKRKPGKKGGV